MASSRRDFLKGGTAVLGSVAAPGTVPLAHAQSRSLTSMRAVEAVAAMRNGEMRAENYAAEDARMSVRPKLQETFRRYFLDNGVQALVFPSALCPATRIGEEPETEWGGEKKPLFVVYSRNVAPGNCASLPGLVLPGGMTATGLPVGIEFDAPTGSDRELLGLGFALEKALGSVPAPGV